MTVKNDVHDFIVNISPKAVCDDCIAKRLGISPRQHANHKTRELANTQVFERLKDKCTLCEKVKLVISYHDEQQQIFESISMNEEEKTMTESVSNELLLENLKAIQGKLSIMASDIVDLKADMLTVKGHMAAFMQAEIRQDSAAASLTVRVERIERRLELRE